MTQSATGKMADSVVPAGMPHDREITRDITSRFAARRLQEPVRETMYLMRALPLLRLGRARVD